MPAKIDTVAARARLAPRREPYWHPLARGNYLGFRKMSGGSAGQWVARVLDAATRKRVFSPLGEFDALAPNERFDAACRAAQEWFRHLERGGHAGATTIRVVCSRYVEHLAREKRGTARLGRAVRPKQAAPGAEPAVLERKQYIPAAREAEQRFQNYVLNLPWLADLEVAKLQPRHVDEWRKALLKAPARSGANRGGARTASTLNRDMTAFRAALNLAFADGLVTSNFAWNTKLRPIRNADRQRELYLDRAQRQRLLAHAQSDIGQLLQGLNRLPLRPSALAKTLVSHFDSRLSILQIGTDKNGKPRKIKLPPATAALLATQCKDKLPSAHIFTRVDGRPWDKDGWKGPVKDAVRAAKLPHEATAYTLRHSTITDLVVGGLDLLTVAQISGTSVRMIEQHYGHLRADHAAAALAMLG